MNTGDDGKVGISADGTTAARIFEGTMNGTSYCDVPRKELTQSIGKSPNKSASMFQQDLTPWHTSKLVQEKVATIKGEHIRMSSEKFGSQSN